MFKHILFNREVVNTLDGVFKHSHHSLYVAWVGVVTKVARFLSSEGKPTDMEEVRKWFQIIIPYLDEKIDDILSLEETKMLVRDALPEGRWQSAVAFSQTLLLLGIQHVDVEELKERLRILLEKWNSSPVNYSALLSELRKKTISFKTTDRSIIETLVYDTTKDSYFSPDISQTSVEFFLNYLRFEEGVDVDSIVEKVKNVVEKENLVEEVLRLSDIDAIISGKEFAERVERVVDILGKVKEQGLDVEKVVMRWDELANSGGERFEYLERAVKEVADEEVADRFWKEVEKVLGNMDVPVLLFRDKKDDELFRLFLTFKLAEVKGTSVSLTEEGNKLLSLSLSIVEKYSPSALYSFSDIEKVLDMLFDHATSTNEVLTRAEVLASLSSNVVKTVISNEGYRKSLFDLIPRTVMKGMDVKRFVESVEKTLKEGLSPTVLKSMVEEET